MSGNWSFRRKIKVEPLKGSDIEAAVRAFTYAFTGLTTHMTVLGIRPSDLQPVHNAVVRARDIPAMRVRAAYRFLSYAGSTLALDAESRRSRNPQLEQAIAKYENILVRSHGADYVAAPDDEVGRTFLGQTALGLHRTLAHTGKHASLAQGRQRVPRMSISQRVDAASTSRYGNYLASQALEAALFLVDFKDLQAYVAAINERGDGLPSTPPLPFPSVFVAFTEPHTFGAEDFQRVAVVAAEGMQTESVLAAGTGSERYYLNVASEADTPGIFAMYLNDSSHRMHQMKPRSVGKGRAAPTVAAQSVRVVETGSWRSRLHDRATSVQDVQEEEATLLKVAHDRRGTYVRYPLDENRLLAMGLEPRADAEHFWIGWRRDTRVNDPEFQKSRVRTVVPSDCIQVRRPVPHRPDLPNSFQVYDVFAETVGQDVPAFERIGSHPRSVEILGLEQSKADLRL